MTRFVTLTKALADESRFRILRLLMQEELCVCQIIETMPLAPSTISKHLLLLKQAGLIDSRKCGRWIYYRMADVGKNSVITDAVNLVKKGLRQDRRIAGDLKTLKRVLRLDREALCRKQSGR